MQQTRRTVGEATGGMASFGSIPPKSVTARDSFVNWACRKLCDL